MKRIALTLLFALVAASLAVPASAAKKGSKKVAESKSALQWTRTVDLGVVYTDGNTETFDANYGFDIGVASDVNSVRWTFAGLYGEDRNASDDKTTKNRIDSVIRAEHFISDRQSLVLNFSYLYDEPSNVDYAFILSPAYAFYILKNPDVLELSVEAGPAAVWRRDGDESRDYVTARIAERFFWAFSSSASIEQTVEYLPDLGGDAEGDLINASVAVVSAMTDHLALKLGATDKYNGAPAEGADENDLALTAALQLTF